MYKNFSSIHSLEVILTKGSENLQFIVHYAAFKDFSQL